jgi:CHASE2 domain-containing sensor protein
MLEMAPVSEVAPPLILDERKFYREWWLTSLLALSVLVLMTSLQWGQSPGQVIYDQFHHWLTPQANPQVVVVAIDDQSLDALGGWPLQRGVYAELLRQLAPPAHKPQGLAFDILFLDPSPADAELAKCANTEWCWPRSKAANPAT